MPSRTGHRSARSATLLALLLALLFSVASSFAYADDSLTWSLTPVDNEHGTGRPNFSYALDPGATVTDAVQVTNKSPRELTLKVYAADGFTTTSGDLDLLPADKPSVGLGAWLSTSTQSLTLAPGESKPVEFTIKVPADAQPGDHPGGIITSFSSGEGTVKVDQRFALRIHTRISGELTVSGAASGAQAHAGAAWVPVAPVPVTIDYNLENTGNARAYFTYQAELSGPFGLGKKTVTGELPEVMPGSTVTPELRIDGVAPLFFLSGDLTLTPQAVDGQVGQPIVLAVQAGSIPWGTLALLLLIIVAAVTIGVIRARRNWEWEDEDDDLDDDAATSETSAADSDPAAAPART